MEQGTNPHFFKIILPSALGDRNKLRIPQMFLKKYGHHVSNCDSVYLQIPNGSIWEVELMRYKGHVWIYKGWQEFAEYHSIAYGYFLVFRYEGNSKFHVIIFDHSATEIEYSVKDNTMSHHDHHIEQDIEMDCQEPQVDGAPNIDDHEEEEVRDDDYVSIEILNDFPRNTVKKKDKVEGYVQSATTRAKKRSNLDPCVLRQGVQPKRSRTAGKEIRRSYFPEESSRICTHDHPKGRALQRAKALKCSGPSFMVQMKASHVSDQFRVHICTPHFRKYLAGKHDNVVLMRQGPETETWFVKCHIDPRRSQLSTGWKYFALDNHLAIGDVCVFELIMTNSYRVHIFGSHREARRVCDSQTVKDRIRESTKALKSKNPNFHVVMRPTYIGATGYMPIPQHFHKYITDKKGKVSLVHANGGESWSVSCYVTKASIRFASGWSKFARDNYLKVGDVCIFEMMNGLWNSYKFIIIRTLEEL